MNRHTMAAAAAAALLLAAGCGNSRPETCLIDDEGFFTFTLLATQPDYPVTFRGRLASVVEQNTAPPTIRYTFARDGGGSVILDTNDLGWTMPLDPGVTYDVELDLVVDQWLDTYSIVATDSAGVALVVESDWDAANENGGAFDYVRRGNDYGDLPLTVAKNDGGCEAREVNTPLFLSIHNRQMSFRLGGDQLELAHSQTGAVGEYTVHVWRAQEQVAKQSNDPDNGNVQPQMSFYLHRTDLLP